MKRLFAVLLVLLGVSLVLLGLLFLVGAAGRTQRYLVAVLGLALGGATAGIGVRWLKQAEASSPEQLRAEILELARRKNGEVSEAEVESTLGRRATAAGAVLAALQAEGVCQTHSKEGASYLVFPSLQPRLLLRRCEYCRSEFTISDRATNCPNCGGTLKSQVESRSLSAGEHYNMDE